MRNLYYVAFLSILLSGCSFGVNSKTSQIGNLNDKCLDKNAWEKMTELYSIENIKDSSLVKNINEIKNHFIKPKYILYFDEAPREIIGCDYYSIRAVYNANIADQVLSGLSQQLSDREQVRIRNRVQKALMEYQCAEGKLESTEWMKRPAIFSKEYYEE
ncbi:hypothetical protein N9901_00420 [Flavobacteriaceae bacterium]|nr:hypothetical protein [Flavobacteriaceae bacterium]